MEMILAILVALLAIAGVTVCITKPRYALVAVLLLFPAEQILMGYIPELRWRFSWVVNVVVGCIAVFGVGYNLFRGGKVFEGSKNPTTYLVAGLYLYMLAAFLWSPARDSALFFLGQNWPYVVLMMIVAPLLLHGLDDAVNINGALILVGAILMALMLVNPNARFINDRFVISLGYQPGFGEISSNPLAIADAGGMLAIVSALYRPSSPKPLFTPIRWAGILLGLTLALMSGSRGQVIASLGVIVLMVPFVTGAKNPIRTAGSLLMVGLVVMFLMYVFQNFLISAGQNRWTDKGAGQGLGERWLLATTMLEAFGTNPAYWITGLGASAFNAYFTYRPEGLEHWYPHNIAVEALTEYGIFGFALLCGVVVCSVSSAIRLISLAGPDRGRRSTAVFLLGILLFQLFMSMKQGALLGVPPFFMFALIVGRLRANEEAAARRALAEWEEFESSGDCEQAPQDGPLAEAEATPA